MKCFEKLTGEKLNKKQGTEAPINYFIKKA